MLSWVVRNSYQTTILPIVTSFLDATVEKTLAKPSARSAREAERVDIFRNVSVGENVLPNVLIQLYVAAMSKLTLVTGNKQDRRKHSNMSTGPKPRPKSSVASDTKFRMQGIRDELERMIDPNRRYSPRTTIANIAAIVKFPKYEELLHELSEDWAYQSEIDDDDPNDTFEARARVMIRQLKEEQRTPPAPSHDERSVSCLMSYQTANEERAVHQRYSSDSRSTKKRAVHCRPSSPSSDDDRSPSRWSAVKEKGASQRYSSESISDEDIPLAELPAPRPKRMKYQYRKEESRECVSSDEEEEEAEFE